MSRGGEPDSEKAPGPAALDPAFPDASAERAFDDIAELAQALTDASAALVTLVDGRRTWFPRDADGAARAASADGLCARIVADAAPLIGTDVADARGNAGFRVGVPILTGGGRVIGSICVFDAVPRDGGGDLLAMLARQAAALVVRRRAPGARRIDHEVTVREFENLWALAHDLLVVCDADGAVIAANPAWTGIFGPLVAARAVRMGDFLADPAQRPDIAAIEDGGARGFVIDYRGVDGELRTIGWTLRREGDLIYGIGRDDTALRSVERDLAQSQRMEALGQLTGGIAHDFNNLLTIVIGNLDIAKRRLRQGDVARAERAIADAGDGASRAASLTQRLLAFARRQRLAPRAVDPARLLADMAPLIERVVGETVAIVMPPADGDVWPVEVDVGQLENALLNLAANARDAMAGQLDEGRLTILALNHAVDASEASRNGGRAGDHVRLSVADTGTGMTAEVLARALEPFFTTKGVGRGTGLGLSQVDGFVRQSGGFVTIESVAGQGTAVHLWLPRTGVAVDLVDRAPAPSASPTARSGCVMVVEDSDDLRELVVETLREGGYRVIEAHDGRSALSLFARQSVRPDLVLSDVMMPGLDGFALAAEVRARSPLTRVLLMTGYAPEERGWTEPMLVKPFTPAALLHRIGELLGEAGIAAAP